MEIEENGSCILLNTFDGVLEYKRKSENIVEDKKYHHWAYTSDDSMNKILKFSMYCLYGYGAYVFIAEMWTKYT